jgi:hypothetical protein
MMKSNSQIASTGLLHSAQTLEAAVADFKMRWHAQSLELAKEQPKIEPAFTTRPIASSIRTLAALEFDGDVWLAHGVSFHTGLPLVQQILDESIAGGEVRAKKSDRPTAVVSVRGIDVAKFMALRAHNRIAASPFQALFPEDTLVLEAVSHDFEIPLDIVAFLGTVAGLAQATHLLTRCKRLEARMEMAMFLFEVGGNDLWLMAQLAAG